MCILISLLGLIQVQRFYSITDTEMRPKRLITMHIKEYLNRYINESGLLYSSCVYRVLNSSAFENNQADSLHVYHGYNYISQIIEENYLYTYTQWRCQDFSEGEAIVTTQL